MLPAIEFVPVRYGWLPQIDFLVLAPFCGFTCSDCGDEADNLSYGA